MRSTRATLEAGARIVRQLAITEAERDMVIGTLFLAAGIGAAVVLAAFVMMV